MAIHYDQIQTGFLPDIDRGNDYYHTFKVENIAS